MSVCPLLNNYGKDKNMAIVAQTDSNGYFIGLEEDYGEDMPAGCVSKLPEDRAGFVARWIENENDWEYIEDHRGIEGYIKGEPFTIKEPGPLPEGFTVEYVDPRSPEEIRSTEIKARLNQIDNLTIRPLRAKLAGKATADDEKKLGELEDEAEALRAELAGLQ
jgi:hypothetical protein